MTHSYTIKEGDTLLQVAIDNQVAFTDVLELNPKFQPNPDLIYPGNVIILPSDDNVEAIKSAHPVAPVAKQRPASLTGSICSAPQCQSPEIIDLLFVTDRDHTAEEYYCLDKDAQKYILDEIQQTQTLIDTLKKVNEQAPSGKDTSKKALEQHVLQRQSWLDDAIYAGVIAPKTATEHRISATSTAQNENSNKEQVNAKIKELNERIQFVKRYNPLFRESSDKDLQARTIAALNQERSYWQTLTVKAAATPQKPASLKIALETLNHSHSSELTQGHATRHIREVLLVSANRLIYLREDFFQREKNYWKQNSHHTNLRNVLAAADPTRLKRALADDLQQGILKNKTLPVTLKNNLNSWTADGWHWKSWQAKNDITNNNGDTLFALNSSAQLFRWGAQASADADGNLKDRKLDLGISASGSLSLAEAAINASVFFPYEKGWGLSLSYTDANGQPAIHSFGRSRFHCSIELSAFSGALVSGNVGAGNTPERPSGSDVILTPNVNLGPCRNGNGQIGLKAEGFAGAQVGGKVTGGVEWLSPQKEETSPLEFATLASLGSEGNLACGAGAGVDFKLSLIQTKFYLHCSARVVWGVGAQGGFAVVLDVGKLWELAQVIWDGLQCVDYRQLKNIDRRSYKYLVHSSYLAFASDIINNPQSALMHSVNQGRKKINEWWENRKTRQAEAYHLSRRIIDEKQDVWGGMPKDRLPPETVGMMLDTLVEDFAFRRDERQELAICLILRDTTYSWRKFDEILCRMNKNGEKANDDQTKFNNLARINAILDGGQQRQFNHWVHQLAKIKTFSTMLTRENVPLPPAPFSNRLGDVFRKKALQIDQQFAALGTHYPRYYS